MAASTMVVAHLGQGAVAGVPSRTIAGIGALVPKSIASFGASAFALAALRDMVVVT